MANIVEVILTYQIETAILALIGFILGLFISLIYWKGKIRKAKDQIKELENAIEGKEVDFKKIRVRAQELLIDKDKDMAVLRAQINENKEVLKNREKDIAALNTQIGQKEGSINELTLQLGLKNESIEVMKKEIAELKQMHRETMSRAEEAENKVAEINSSVEELMQALNAKESEATSLKARIRYMQDDFSSITGIGPKVSAVLRAAGINNFTRLATANIDKLNQILEKENPSLLRLTDPATWPEQARLASEEDWEALSALQESLKGKRRSQASTH
ncbi:hypothetical protein E2P71_03610 [Candidatus Bathyarchaeota archaeon]|nr:hypothetical protein E2P71_03610 [Candidatus Bathyarchaeota archaeon]